MGDGHGPIAVEHAVACADGPQIDRHQEMTDGVNISGGRMSGSNMADIGDSELMKLRDWANAELAKGTGEPWHSMLLVRLAETLDALLAGRAARRSQEPSPVRSPVRSLRVVGGKRPQLDEASKPSGRERKPGGAA